MKKSRAARHKLSGCSGLNIGEGGETSIVSSSEYAVETLHIYCLCNDSTLAAGNFNSTSVSSRIIFAVINNRVVFICCRTSYQLSLQTGKNLITIEPAISEKL